jgi:hypothetical protein
VRPEGLKDDRVFASEGAMIMTRQSYEKEGFEAHVSMTELTDGDLEKASGSGKIQHGDLQCQKYLDKASIILF